ncbi:unnamed protein product [Lactuca saligna]|uniref:Cytochrome c oxidase subunit 3 n=1 Tax=Lactuca saligna TaxID=75948 RepID=A0AA36E970_LACSI|nr:unnamed protein product [Lactuca saligna]
MPPTTERPVFATVAFFYARRRLRKKKEVWIRKTKLSKNPSFGYLGSRVEIGSKFPFLNTLIPLSSGATVTWAHHAILAGKEKRAVYALVATVSLALVFTAFQGMEYYQAPPQFRIVFMVLPFS